MLLSQLGYVTSRGFHRTLAPLGLEPRQFAMLRLISDEEGRSQQAISTALNIPASRMVALVDDLEHRGLLERRPDPDDRRAKALFLTADGRGLLRRAFTLAGGWEATVCAGLSEADRGRLLGLLGRIADNFRLTAGVHPELTEDR